MVNPILLIGLAREVADHCKVFGTNCESMRIFRSIIWPLLNLDCGIFYHSLALSVFCLSTNASCYQKDDLVSEGLFYYNKGLKSVNDRLGDSLRRQGDGIIASIMGKFYSELASCTSRRNCKHEATRRDELSYYAIPRNHLSNMCNIVHGKGR